MRSALAFLTTVPVGHRATAIRRATLVAFPVVGLALGLSWWATATVGAWVWGPVVAASTVLVVDLVLTGGLHLDAVADVADGVGSRRRGEDLRAVLADPRIGAIGAAALGTVLLVRFAAIAESVTDGRAVALILVPVVGRVGMVLALATLPQTAGSLTADLVEMARGAVAVTAVAALGVAAVVIGLAGAGLFHVVAAAVLGVAVAAGLAGYWRTRHGFASGDVVGAAGVLAETVGLLVLSA